MFHLAKVADSGFQDAGAYDVHRPSYRPGVVSAFLGRLQIFGDGAAQSKAGPIKVIEIGAGTGKFTEILSRKAVSVADSASPASIIAVEPHAQMRAQLVAKNLPHVTVVDGHAADLSMVEDGTADAVVVAQAFHWFANIEALTEIHRVLQPGAFVGVIWNIEDYNKPFEWPASTPYEQALNDIILSLGHDGSPRFRDGKWQEAFEQAAQDNTALYAPLENDCIHWTVQLTPDALWKRLLTLSQIANLAESSPEDDKEAGDNTTKPTSKAVVHRRVEAVIARDDVERNAQGQLTLHAVTYFAWAKKL